MELNKASWWLLRLAHETRTVESLGMALLEKAKKEDPPSRVA